MGCGALRGLGCLGVLPFLLSAGLVSASATPGGRAGARLGRRHWLRQPVAGLRVELGGRRCGSPAQRPVAPGRRLWTGERGASADLSRACGGFRGLGDPERGLEPHIVRPFRARQLRLFCSLEQGLAFVLTFVVRSESGANSAQFTLLLNPVARGASNTWTANVTLLLPLPLPSSSSQQQIVQLSSNSTAAAGDFSLSEFTAGEVVLISFSFCRSRRSRVPGQKQLLRVRGHFTDWPGGPRYTMFFRVA